MVKYISDRIAVMHFGKIVELGTSDEIYYHPYMIILNHCYLRFLNLILIVKEQENELCMKKMNLKMQNVDCKKLDLIITFCNR